MVAPALSGRSGRPPNVAARVRRLMLLSASAAAESLIRQAELGDAVAAEAVVRLALDLEQRQKAGGGNG